MKGIDIKFVTYLVHNLSISVKSLRYKVVTRRGRSIYPEGAKIACESFL